MSSGIADGGSRPFVGGSNAVGNHGRRHLKWFVVGGFTRLHSAFCNRRDGCLIEISESKIR
jgi:hypothetical protein